MGAAAVLELIQAAAALLPELAQVLPSAEAAVNGTATAADVANLKAVTVALNAQAAAAEAAAGATGPEA